MHFHDRWMIIHFRWDCPVKKPNREREESVSGPILLKISSIPPYAYVDNESKKVLGDRGLSIRRNLDELSVFFPKVMPTMSVTTQYPRHVKTTKLLITYHFPSLIPAHQ